jgi:hypothetical protein
VTSGSGRKVSFGTLVNLIHSKNGTFKKIEETCAMVAIRVLIEDRFEPVT